MAAAVISPTTTPRIFAGSSAPAGLASHGITSFPQRRRRRRMASTVKCTEARGEQGASTAILAAAAVMSRPAAALVDERMSTEGTGLGLGVSNNLLGWILVGIFALGWSLYFVYTSTLDEDEESGLSL